jgi:hypothetical protein
MDCTFRRLERRERNAHRVAKRGAEGCIDVATNCLSKLFEHPDGLPAMAPENCGFIERVKSGTSFAHVSASLTGTAEIFRDQEGLKEKPR